MRRVKEENDCHRKPGFACSRPALLTEAKAEPWPFIAPWESRARCSEMQPPPASVCICPGFGRIHRCLSLAGEAGEEGQEGTDHQEESCRRTRWRKSVPDLAGCQGGRTPFGKY
ncbi:hypothetical protein VNO77_14463 [Canavalia gladiata]|uniref:Uncharacterized protein n=1 Tax=Canavalia gladiata TaxID=3824 RepID=A0AAN9LYV8_CANGL